MNEFKMLKTYSPRDHSRSEKKLRLNDAGYGLCVMTSSRIGPTLPKTQVRLKLILTLN